jgi:hypothetical protein
LFILNSGEANEGIFDFGFAILDWTRTDAARLTSKSEKVVSALSNQKSKIANRKLVMSQGREQTEHGVRSRVIACRQRLRRTRVAQRALARLSSSGLLMVDELSVAEKKRSRHGRVGGRRAKGERSVRPSEAPSGE